MATAIPIEVLAAQIAYRKRYGSAPNMRAKFAPIPVHIVEWAETRFYIPSTSRPIVLQPHQKAWLNLAFTRNERGDLPYQTLIYSCPKQGGKSTIAGLAMRWYAETQQQGSELYCIGNDEDQAKLRSFREIRYSLEQTPGYHPGRDILPGEWILQKTQMRCLRTRSEIRALSVDPRGEAGGKPAMQCWTELWGAENSNALRFWEELTPIPTIPDSIRIVETYAGYEGESKLLKSLYDTGMEGRQLTAGELAQRTDTEIGVFAEATDRDDPVPIWESGRLLMYWDSGEIARRMPWQRGEKGREYYASQERDLLPRAFDRMHRNFWTSSESAFVAREVWSGCYDEALATPLPPGDKTPLVLAVDGATTNDCFAIVAMSRHPERHSELAVRAVKIYDPRERGRDVDYDEAERFLRFICKGGWPCTAQQGWQHPVSLADVDRQDDQHAQCFESERLPGYNVIQISYDPYQLEAMMQRLTRDRIAWCEKFTQGVDRLRSDRQLYDSIINRILWHGDDSSVRDPGDLHTKAMRRLTSHVLAAGAETGKDGNSMRLVKIVEHQKIDAAVALSMASSRCLYLLI